MRLYDDNPPFYFVPILHYTMECAVEVRKAIEKIQPDCIAVELPEPLQQECLHAAARLPDLTLIHTEDSKGEKKILLAEPCDAAFEALRSALEMRIASFCIDLNVSSYPLYEDHIPDPYAIYRIGLKKYYQLLRRHPFSPNILDHEREEHMARRLKELSFSYEKIVIVVGMSHVHSISQFLNKNSFVTYPHIEYTKKTLTTPTQETALSIMAEYGWISAHYESWRNHHTTQALDRQKCIYSLLKAAILPYEQETRTTFPVYGLSLIMRYLRKYAHIKQKLLPDLYQLLTASKSCIDHNFAYEVWKIAVEYPFLRNTDNLPESAASIEEVWGSSKQIWFHKKNVSKKSSFLKRLKKEKQAIHFTPLNPFTLCSHTPEDGIVEDFSRYIKKKSLSQAREAVSRSIPFSTSLEDGVDVKETIRHCTEKKLFVKTTGKPIAGAGSVVVIFDEDQEPIEKYPWQLTWLGENEQESDMAFFATNYQENVIGPGIAKCTYGGFLLSYPPRRMLDIWTDPDYDVCSSKAEVLTCAAIDYSVKPVIIYVAAHPPKEKLKQYARTQGKKLLYTPISQFSKLAIRKVQIFHVLDGHHRRAIANEYIL